MQRFVLLSGLALMLGSVAACENRKQSCERLYEKIAACNPKELQPSKRARMDFLANCQREYDKGTVKKTRECAKKHADCEKMRQCIQQALKIAPKEP